jgi:hypothetical protein
MNSGPVAVRAVLAGWIKKQTRLLFFSLHQIRSRLFSHSVTAALLLSGRYWLAGSKNKPVCFFSPSIKYVPGYSLTLSASLTLRSMVTGCGNVLQPFPTVTREARIRRAEG